MKNLHCTMGVLAVFVLASGAALADNPVIKEIPIQGNVKAIAVFPTAPSISDNTNATPNGSGISINGLADDDLHTNFATFTITYPSVTLNYMAKIGIYSEKNGIRTPATGTIPAGFTNRVNYIALLTVNDSAIPALELITGGVEPTKSAISEPILPFTKDIAIVVTINADANNRLMEGDYSDKLTLKIGSEL